MAIINWIATQARQGVLFDFCELASVFHHATVAVISKAHKLPKRVKDNSFVKISKLADNGNYTLVAYQDASHPNLKDGCSQGGQALFLTDSTGKSLPPIA